MTARRLVDDLHQLFALYGVEGLLVSLHAEQDTLVVETATVSGPLRFVTYELSPSAVVDTSAETTPLHDAVVAEHELERRIEDARKRVLTMRSFELDEGALALWGISGPRANPMARVSWVSKDGLTRGSAMVRRESLNIWPDGGRQ